ncbi:MAG: hypothetical protein KF905_14130 [Flavobacteriales bacterium]|nr:hypothetical protein [Flavobacteriales bacterium]
MNSSALILMVSVQLVVICCVGYFYYRVLTTPKRPEPDSYVENDNDTP